MPSFAEDIRPLFREGDRTFMEYMFDLWDYEDVKRDADLIYERVADGTMPCDQPWAPEQVQLLRDWIDEGCAP